MKEKKVEAESIGRIVDNIEADILELSSGLGKNVRLVVDSD